MSLVQDVVECRVSSVLNNDRKQFGKKYIFDGNDETCWNSDQGTPQWIQFGFRDSRTITKVSLQFQGGFVGKQCQLEALDDSGKKFQFAPLDINSLQEFVCDEPLTSRNFKLIFNSSTDFYGRIILYHLQLF